MNTCPPHNIGEENLGEVGNGYYDLREGVAGNPYMVEFLNPAAGRERETIDEIMVVAGEINEALDIAFAVHERNGGKINCDTEVDHKKVSWTDLMGHTAKKKTDDNNAATLALELAYISGMLQD